MVRVLRTFLWLIGGLALLGVLVSLGIYVVSACWTDWVFNREFLNRLGADLSAVVLGVPIALGVRDFIRRGKLAEQRRSQAEHAASVLNLLHRELEHNGDLLLARKGSELALPTEPLKDDLWQALTRSGELPWLHDPEVLDRLATAYYYIRALAELESAMAHTGAGLGPGGTMPEGHRRYMEELADRALRHVVLALETLEKHLDFEPTSG